LFPLLKNERKALKKKQKMKQRIYQLGALFLVVIFVLGCAQNSALRSEDLFTAWEKDSNQIIQKNNTDLSDFELSIKDLVGSIYCQAYPDDLRSEFPKLKYKIVPDEIQVGTVAHFTNDLGMLDYPEPEFKSMGIFSDCEKVKLLLATEQYRKKVYGKLRPGFGSNQDKKNQAEALALLERHYSTKNGYRAPEWISQIVVNEQQDSAMVHVNTIYSTVAQLFVRDDAQWLLSQTLWEVME
jgi:hypothetical protein